MNKGFIREVGLLRWVWRTARRQFFKRLLKRDHCMRLPTGERLSLPRTSKFASEAFITRGNVDWGSEALLFKMLNKRGVFFDVGANIGYYSLYMLPRVRQVYSFEPDPRMRAHLQKNVANRNIQIVAKALGRKPGRAAFTLENDGELSHLATRAEYRTNNIEVDVTTVDSFVRENNIDDLEAIKIDVEGFDIDVIAGAMETLQSQRPIVLTEARPTPELFSIADETGYSAFAYARYVENQKVGFVEVRLGGLDGLQIKMLFLIPQELNEAICVGAM